MRELVKIFVVAGLTTATEASVATIFPPFLHGSGYHVGEIGLIVALFSVAMLFSRMPSGLLYRRETGRWVATISVAVLGASTAAYAWLPESPFLLLWTILHGLSYGVIGTVLLALALDTRPEGTTAGALMGWYTALLAGGHGVGNSTSGFAVDMLGFSNAFLLAGALQLPAVWLCWSLHPSTRGASPAPRSGSTPGSMDRTLRALRSPGVVKASMLGLYMNVMDQTVNAFAPIFALSAGLSLTTFGLVKTTKNIFATFVRVFTGPIVERIGLARINTSLVVGFGVAVFLLPFSYGPLPFAALFAVIGVCRGLLRATSGALLVEDSGGARGRRLGVASGVYNSAMDIGSIVGPAVSGFVAAAVGIPAMLQIVSATLLALTGIIVLGLRRFAGAHTLDASAEGQEPPSVVPSHSGRT